MTTRVHLERNAYPTVPRSALREWQFQSDRAAAKMQGILEGYAPVSLAEMETVSLLKRVDTKYVLPTRQLLQALRELGDRYRVLEIQGRRLNLYHNLYFDTPDFYLYYQHHNQQRNRYKVRSREYVDSHLIYLEVKCKNNRDQTIKSRLRTEGFASDFSQRDMDFLAGNYPYKFRHLQPVLWNDFVRITLVSKQAVERLTLDINLQFSSGLEQIGLPHVAVAEVKQDRFSVYSDFVQQMRAMKVQPQRFSKYCMGIGLFYPQVKRNRFKPRTLLVERIMCQGANRGHLH